MGVDGLRIGVQFRKYMIIRPIKLCYRSVHNHPFLVGILLFLLFLYRLSPFVFSLLVSASPVLVCTALLLGTLLSFGQPNLPEVEKDESYASEIASLKTDKSECDTVHETDVNFGGDGHDWFTEVRRETLEDAIDYLSSQGDTDRVTKDDGFAGNLMLADENSLEFHFEEQFTAKLGHASETLDVEERKGTDGDTVEDTHDPFEMRRDMAEDVMVDVSLQNNPDGVSKSDLDDGLSHNSEPADHSASEVQLEEHLIEEGHQFKNLNVEDHGSKMGVVDEHVSRDCQVHDCRYTDLMSFDHENAAEGSGVAFLRDNLESSFVAWKQMDDDYYDSELSDSGSDGAESSSPDASMADIIPMLDELHPLIETENPRDDTKACESFVMNDEASEKSDESSICSDEESDHKEEDGAADDSEEKKDTQGGKESTSESAILWTEDDQKNLMELGISELERNHRLESLIARRRARRMMTERNLIDFDGTDFSFQLTPITTTRLNPFDFHQHSYDDLGLPPIPGSAPSAFFPRRNPFDLPYDSSEEKPDLMGDSFQEEFTQLNQKEQPIFRRHESFNIGSSSFEFPSYKGKGTGQASRFRPFFGSEGTSYSSFQRQPSDISESKASSTAETYETESTSAAGDHDEMRPANMSITGDEVTMRPTYLEPVFEANDSYRPTEHEARSLEDVRSTSTVSSESDASSDSDDEMRPTGRSITGDEVTIGPTVHEPVFEANESDRPTEHEGRSLEDVRSTSAASSESDASSDPYDEMRPTGRSTTGGEVTIGPTDHEPVFEANDSYRPTEHESRSLEDVRSASTVRSESDANSDSDNESVVTSVAGDEKQMKGTFDHFVEEGEPLFDRSHSFDDVDHDGDSSFHGINESNASSSTVIVDRAITSKSESEKEETPTHHAVSQVAETISELHYATDHVDCGVGFHSSSSDTLELSSAANDLILVDDAELKLATRDTGEVYHGSVQEIEPNSEMEHGVQDATGDRELMPTSAADASDKESALIITDPEAMDPADGSFFQGVGTNSMHHVECHTELVFDGINEQKSSSTADMGSTSISEFREEMKPMDCYLVQQEVSATDIHDTPSTFEAVDTSQRDHDIANEVQTCIEKDHILDDSAHVGNLLSIDNGGLKVSHSADTAGDESTAVTGDPARMQLGEHANEAVENFPADQDYSLILHDVDPVSSVVSESKSSSSADTADIGSVSIARDQNTTNLTDRIFDQEVSTAFKSDGSSDLFVHDNEPLSCGHGEINSSPSNVDDTELTAAGRVMEELKMSYHDLARGLEMNSQMLCASSPANQDAHLLSSANKSEATAAEVVNIESKAVAQNQEEINPTEHESAHDTESGFDIDRASDAIEHDANPISGELNVLTSTSASDIVDIDSTVTASDPKGKMSSEDYFSLQVELSCDITLPSPNTVEHDITSVSADTAETNSSSVDGYQVETRPIYDVAEEETTSEMEGAPEHREHDIKSVSADAAETNSSSVDGYQVETSRIYDVAEEETTFEMEGAPEHREHDTVTDSDGPCLSEAVSDAGLRISGLTLVGVQQKEGEQTDCDSEAEISSSWTSVTLGDLEHHVDLDSSIPREMASTPAVVQSLSSVPDDLDKKPSPHDFAEEVESVSAQKPDCDEQVLNSISKSTSEPMTSSSTEIYPIQQASEAGYQVDIKPTAYDHFPAEEKLPHDMNDSALSLEQESKSSETINSSVGDQHMIRDFDLNVDQVGLEDEMENVTGMGLNSDNEAGDKRVEAGVSEERDSKIESGLSERRHI